LKRNISATCNVKKNEDNKVRRCADRPSSNRKQKFFKGLSGLFFYRRLTEIKNEAMNPIEKRFRNDRINFPSFPLFRGFDSNPPREKEKAKGMYRPPTTDFVVDWQLNDKEPEKRQVG
jgi:hypothetical protein